MLRPRTGSVPGSTTASSSNEPDTPLTHYESSFPLFDAVFPPKSTDSEAKQSPEINGGVEIRSSASASSTSLQGGLAGRRGEKVPSLALSGLGLGTPAGKGRKSRHRLGE